MWSANVSMADDSIYTVTKLLGTGDSNAKLTKSDNSGKGYLTVGLSLSPANESGYEVCASRSAGCTKACLFTAGRGAYDNVKTARIAKTRLFFQDRENFLSRLRRELSSQLKRADKAGKRLAVRLNVLSDIPWEKIAPDLFSDFPDVQFYDYTKHVLRMKADKRPANYHLTYSRSENNDPLCRSVLKAGGNVAVVFDTPSLPAYWEEYPVINGDETDLRFLDPAGVVVGLYAKGRAKKDTSGFVISLPVLT